jgi:intein/homing endonuclease
VLLCFDIESLVTMASGQSKKLKNIIIGDKLQGFSFPNEIDESEGDYMLWNGKLNEATKTEVTVVSKQTSVQPNYYEIITADTTIKVTGQHPLLVSLDGENVQYVCVKNVIPSMLLVDKTGNTKVIESILFKEEPLEVALLDVENVDNYVISGIVVHNSKPIDPKDPNAPGN